MDNDDYTAKMTDLIELMRIIGNDTQQCEVKECRRRISTTITETLSAFSNGNGGYIVLGLSEKAGFTPVEGFNARAMQEALSQACEKLTPVVRPVIVTCPFEGSNLVFAVIDEMQPREKPCFITTAGPYNGSYIRTGDGDRHMTSYEVDRLMEEHGQPAYDVRPVGEATFDDLNPMLLHALLTHERQLHPHVFADRSDIDMMFDLRILTTSESSSDGAASESEHDGRPAGATSESVVPDDAHPTLAALLAVGRYPQKFFPRLNVTVAMFPGTAHEDVFDGASSLITAETFTGPIPTMIDDAVDALMRWTTPDDGQTAFPEDSPMQAAHDGAPTSGASRRSDAPLPAYPADVLREAISNALTHRDYSPDALGTPVHINIYTDRLEIGNPGGLFGKVTKRTLSKPATPSTRNPFLFALLQSTPYPDGGTVITSGGAGYLNIEATLRREGREPARIENTIETFRIIIPKHGGSISTDTDGAASRILALLRRQPTLGTRDIMLTLGLPPATVAAALRQLANRRLIDMDAPAPIRQRYVRLTPHDRPEYDSCL